MAAEKMEGGPAFACDPDQDAWEGMTLRQWYIGQALMGAMLDHSMDPALAAEYAIQAADKVMARLREEGSVL